MALRASRGLLALKPTTPALKFGKWDPRMFGDMMRPFNQRELTEGYHAHSMVGWMEDWHGNQAIAAKPFWARFKRGYGFLLLFWFGGWTYYIFNSGLKNPGCPWSKVYDPSRERSF
ncbi:hypothetical protein DIPPA_11508 [Diplonema papillatum]|nr:hypothetical protein DIPPA_11508 [Diplonema papillatum]